VLEAGAEAEAGALSEAVRAESHAQPTGEEGGGGGGGGEVGGVIDETSAAQHYEQWKLARQNARRAPLLDAAPEEPWVDGKPGLFSGKVPKWVTAAYHKNVLIANKWRNQPAPRFVKDTSEFEPVTGPAGFRDQRPSWLREKFGSGMWEDRLVASRAAAREFGTYRKSMWKVKLRACDGAKVVDDSDDVSAPGGAKA
jgi:hypothetical protein